LFLALSFLHVRDSHFGVTDVTMTALVVLTVLAVTRWQETGGLGRAALAGVAGGLAASTKYNGLGVAVSFLAAAGQRVFDARTEAPAAFKSCALSTLAFGCALTVAFFGASPYILIDWPRFQRDISAVQSTLAQGHGMNVGQGWVYFARVVLPAGVGWPIFLASTAGVLVLLTTRLRQSGVVLAFPLAYYLVAGRGYAVFARHIVPVVPFLCITAAWIVVRAVRAGTPAATPIQRGAVVAVVAVLMVAPTARQTLLADRLLARVDNRVVTARALGALIPPGSVVCQTGAAYGRVPPTIDGQVVPVGECDYDEGAQRFTADPGWVVVQRSPLVLYSAVSESLERTLRERFVLVARYPTESSTASTSAAVAERVYDQQDAFYLPLRGLDGLTRPGPAFELYKRRVD
jgi:hypothetical protein